VASSLGLAGDLDDVELIEDIEEAFGLRFSEDQLGYCRTVGDIFALIEASIPVAYASARHCGTAMCFYRIRRALQPRIDTQLRPNTAMEALSGISVRELYQIIKNDCGFRPPNPVISLWGCVALLLVGVLPLASVGLGATWWLATAWALPAIGLYSVAPVRLPKNVISFGDLVRIVAARNIGALAAEGARVRTKEAWNALKEIASDHSETKDAIDPDTLIYAPSTGKI
jgi:hypothetical protein